MTTKKQKRLQMEEKRAREAEETRLSGLKAQRVDREVRAHKEKLAQEAAADEELRLANILLKAREEEYQRAAEEYKQASAREAINAMAPKP